MLRKTKNSIEFVQNKGVNPVYVARQAILDALVEKIDILEPTHFVFVLKSERKH